MSQTIRVTDDISIVFGDRMLEKLVLVPPKTGKRNKMRRMAVMRANLIRDARALQRESRRHKATSKIISAGLYKDLRLTN